MTSRRGDPPHGSISGSTRGGGTGPALRSSSFLEAGRVEFLVEETGARDRDRWVRILCRWKAVMFHVEHLGRSKNRRAKHGRSTGLNHHTPAEASDSPLQHLETKSAPGPILSAQARGGGCERIWESASFPYPPDPAHEVLKALSSRATFSIAPWMFHVEHPQFVEL